MASGVRPFLISKTPDIDEENKKYSIANSVASGIIKFAMAEAIAIPVENSLKKINNSPEKYLNSKTVKVLSGEAKKISESKNYQFASQFLKLLTGLITAIPKSVITIALIPLIMKTLFPKKKEVQKTNISSFAENKIFDDIKQKSYNQVLSSAYSSSKSSDNLLFLTSKSQSTSHTLQARRGNLLGQPSFKGCIGDTALKGVTSILENGTFQEFAINNSKKSADIARNMSIATDILLTASFIHRTDRSKKIEQDRKKALIYNSLISTGISILGGYFTDKLVQKSTKEFIDKFKAANKNNPKLGKYMEGINVLRPTIIFAGLYYGILPVISTYLADKTDKFVNSK